MKIACCPDSIDRWLLTASAGIEEYLELIGECYARYVMQDQALAMQSSEIVTLWIDRHKFCQMGNFWLCRRRKIDSVMARVGQALHLGGGVANSSDGGSGEDFCVSAW